MSWSYSGNPGSSALDEVRFLTTDTDQTKAYSLQDEEINYALTLYSANPPVIGKNFRAAANCASTILGKFKSSASSKGVGDLHLDFGKGFDFFSSLYNRLEARANIQAVPMYAGGLSLAEKAVQNANQDRVQPVAKIDGMNHPGEIDDNSQQ